MQSWSISHLVKASGLGDIDIFYGAQQGILISLEEVDKVTDELYNWCKQNIDILFLIECYSRSGWNWSENFCTLEDLEPLLEADWIDDDDPLKVEARLFIEKGNAHQTYCEPSNKIKKHIPVHGYVYVLRAPSMDPSIYKIGREKEYFARIDTLGIKLPWDLEVVVHIESNDYVALEAELHQRFSKMRVKGEWFELTEENIEYLKGLTGEAKI